MKIRKAIIPAGGLGTRFLPVTKALPKEMLPILDKPVIQFIVEEAITSGIEDILIISGRSKRAIEDHFDKSYELESILEKRQKYDLLEEIRGISRVNIHYIRQKEPNGLGDAVLQAQSFIGKEPFLLMLGDDIVETADNHPPCAKQLMEQYELQGCPVIGVKSVSPDQVSRYGIIQTDQDTITAGATARVLDLVEKPAPGEAPSNIAIMGRYVLDSAIFDILAYTPAGVGGEVQLTDALRKYNQTSSVLAYCFHGTRHDIGTPLGFLKANLMFALQNPAYHSEVIFFMEELLRREGCLLQNE
ncbi:UTP--glucose-1-phosphate uridylyltransferase GalU [Paenactinomyces guangxiensis]|uniref:UTP--glucose-1-phosphate uridylyltransferase n=1 Tax=Paenactinomyces guangxiensis TaxID=1490290 RepID=A0A7W2A7C5_9BACL|nr:UTP--glucose-1-phosphate uridylyltransferase GalU [Paenactinomyces guangxiensis]MBA4492994.1 UTP--glucose-1-phosphate uridylyltransferase GalU [Paenactinomyces guangxiensis]MBH8590157.1 UTP--glucose-1-phosphate uridylyltransferase GalU [Paenactinomyces guangxiensis]